MTTTVGRRPGVAIARAMVSELGGVLGIAALGVARPGAVGLLAPPVLLRAADGWVHPGPPTVWPDFTAMVRSLGARDGDPLPDVADLAAEAIDREAGAWMLPAVAVRAGPARAPVVATLAAPTRVDGASVVVLGSTWAAPLTGRALGALGADVVRVVDPRRPDPFPLRDALAEGQRELALDLGDPHDRARFAVLLATADLLVDGTTPRVLRNAGVADVPIATVRIAAFEADERPGYGLAAEARGGWAARHDPPRLGRSSVADPVAGLLAAIASVDLLHATRPGARVTVSLESAVGLLLDAEGARG